MTTSQRDGPFGLRALSRYRFAGNSRQAIREERLQPLLVHLGYASETPNGASAWRPAVQNHLAEIG